MRRSCLASLDRLRTPPLLQLPYRVVLLINQSLVEALDRTLLAQMADQSSHLDLTPTSSILVRNRKFTTELLRTSKSTATSNRSQLLHQLKTSRSKVLWNVLGSILQRETFPKPIGPTRSTKLIMKVTLKNLQSIASKRSVRKWSKPKDWLRKRLWGLRR